MAAASPEGQQMALGKHGAELAHQHHASILAAVAAGNPARAADEMRIHMEPNYSSLQTGQPSFPKWKSCSDAGTDETGRRFAIRPALW